MIYFSRVCLLNWALPYILEKKKHYTRWCTLFGSTSCHCIKKSKKKFAMLVLLIYSTLISAANGCEIKYFFWKKKVAHQCFWDDVWYYNSRFFFSSFAGVLGGWFGLIKTRSACLTSTLSSQVDRSTAALLLK